MCVICLPRITSCRSFRLREKYPTVSTIPAAYYFSLKDVTGTLSCVMFAGQRKGLAFRMKDGDQVVVAGTIDVYQRDGRYQMYAREITLEGAGDLYQQFLLLKQELEEMGMFAQDTSRRFPDL